MSFLERPLRELCTHWPPLRFGELQVPEDWKPEFKFVDPKCAVGVELEIENLHRYPKLPGGWSVVRDGSLRNGYELVTKPLRGHKLEYTLRTLFAHIPPEHKFSDRCSIHVHLNVRPFSVGELFNLVLLYCVFEKLLFNYASSKRYNNIFCTPIIESQILSGISTAAETGELAYLMNQWGKYSGMNIGGADGGRSPLYAYGTAEFRHMEGHGDVERLLNWINVLQQLRVACHKHEFLTLREQIFDLTTNSAFSDFVLKVFGQHYGHELLMLTPNVDSVISTTIRAIKAAYQIESIDQTIRANLHAGSPLVTMCNARKRTEFTVDWDALKAERNR